ncbi:hypothetical protein NDU88_000833 [Pleurodeles waltl]|uniref:Uncharacterized protein n=1 Tax=Pleurodeles waltl TaxID=8319 RepID=A0AAV7NAN7_PLEWA|nr:hypothetical protein NDU88_000833 [Pleurodeles waltl]
MKGRSEYDEEVTKKKKKLIQGRSEYKKEEVTTGNTSLNEIFGGNTQGSENEDNLQDGSFTLEVGRAFSGADLYRMGVRNAVTGADRTPRNEAKLGLVAQEY